MQTTSTRRAAIGRTATMTRRSEARARYQASRDDEAMRDYRAAPMSKNALALLGRLAVGAALWALIVALWVVTP
jgi:hypothetical protein